MVNNEKSPIKYKLISFPCGQHNTVLDINTLSFPKETKIEIKTRLNNFIDLEILICIVKCLNEEGYYNLHCFIGHFMGARSDRKFEIGTCNYLKDVICPIINSLNLKSVTILKPHSDVLEASLKNFKKEDVSWKLVDDIIMDNLNCKLNDIKLISPDAGSYKWVNTISREHDIELIQCYKERNLQDGSIIDTKFTGNIGGKNCIILDDLIDGGRSFINIALKLKKSGARTIWLAITHGIFSAGFQELEKYFDGIYCTNSYSDLEAWQDIMGKIITCNHIKGADFIKQLNVFYE